MTAGIQPLSSMITQTVDMGAAVQSANTWRDNLNPMRSLTIYRAVAMYEFAQRGLWADLQWTYRFIERDDPDLFCLVERRIGALLEMQHEAKAMPDTVAGFDKTLAAEQAAALKAAYDRIDNLYEAIEHLAMATFREFSIAQFQSEDEAAAPGDCTHIECLDQWNFIRDGLHGAWFWNPSATNTAASALPKENEVDPSGFLIRVVRRSLDNLGLLKYVRANLCDKDWDSFIEIYGLPAWIAIAPPSAAGVSIDKFAKMAEQVSRGANVGLPHGSEVKPLESPSGTAPFKDRLQYLTEKLVLAGTGGMLTMLNQPTGLGGGQAHVHFEVFKTIARAEARKISEIFQAQFDAPLLARLFPGRPRLAYWELCANRDIDITSVIDHALKLSQTGVNIDRDQLSEITGYKLVPVIKAGGDAVPKPSIGELGLRNRAIRSTSPNDQSPVTNDPSDQSPVTNDRSSLSSAALSAALAAYPKAFAPVTKWLAELEAIAGDKTLDDAAMLSAVEKKAAELPGLLPDCDTKAIAEILDAAMSAALVNGIAESKSAKAKEVA